VCIFKVAAVQMCSGRDILRNIMSVEDSVKCAVNAGAAYVQTPEMTGLLVRDRDELLFKVRRQKNDLLVAAASDLAKKYQIYLHIGSTAILREDGAIANRAFLFSPKGSLITTYDKIHMFDVDLDNGESWCESQTYVAGTKAIVASTLLGLIGLSICYDLRFSQLFLQQACAGAKILTVPAAFTKQTGEAHWHVLLRARAIENGAFIIAAAQAGVHEDGRTTFGHSIIIDPWGRIMVSANGSETDVIYTDIDLSQVDSARQKIPNLKNPRAFSLKTIESKANQE
jgi:deaminated glutathione amidase